MVGDSQDGVVQHGLHGYGEPFLARRHILHRHPAAQAFLAQGEQAVDGKGVNQVFHGFPFVHGTFSGVYPVQVGAAVAGDGYPKYFFHGRPVVGKAAAGIGYPVTGLPTALEPGPGQPRFSGFHEGLHQEDVFIHQFGYHRPCYFLSLPSWRVSYWRRLRKMSMAV